MGKKHLKRLNTPKTWNIKKKGIKYVKRPHPGAHSFKNGMALSVFLRDMLNIGNTTKEIKNILTNNEVLIDGVKRKEVKFIVGFMDVITIPLTKEHFRILFDKKGKLNFIKIDEKEAGLKICKVKGKRMIKKDIQINLSDGKNITLKKKEACKVGDSVLISLPKQEVKEVIKLEKGSLIFLIGGKQSGRIAKVEEIKDNLMKCKTKNDVFETSKRYAYVIGKEKSLIKVEE